MSPDRRSSRSDSRGGRRSDSKRGTRRGDSKRGDSKRGDSKRGDSKRGDSKRGDSKRGDSRRGDSRRGSRRDDRSRSSRSSARDRGDDRDERESGRFPPVKSGSNTPLIVGGVVAAVVVLGLAVIAFSGKPRRVVRPPKTEVVASRRLPQAKNWYAIGAREGREWASHARARAPMASAAGGGSNAFDPKNVRNMADMMTSNWYNKGLRNNAKGQKRFIEGFCKAVLGN